MQTETEGQRMGQHMGHAIERTRHQRLVHLVLFGPVVAYAVLLIATLFMGIWLGAGGSTRKFWRGGPPWQYRAPR